jgi:VIT1/CCC1 family predicted Fe2+/Mn2+ transporter
VGLRTGEHAKLSIIVGILVIALADNIADSMGIHIYQESECLKTREVWLSTFTNFITRLLVSLTFILLVIFLPIRAGIACSLLWGLLLLAAISYTIAKDRQANVYLVILEHLVIAIIVIIASNFIGKLVINKIKF